MHDSELRNKINKNLQERLISLREKRNVTQAVVAESTGISRTSIVAYEKGTSIPDLEKLYLLAEYYGVSCDYLLGRNEGTELDIDYIMKETGLNEIAIKRLKGYVSSENSYLELFALNKLISSPQFQKFLEFYIKYISTPNLDQVVNDIFYLFAFPSYKDAINKEIFNSFDIKNGFTYDTIVYWMVRKEFDEMTNSLKHDENTKRELKRYIDDIMKKSGYNSYVQFYLKANNK